MEQQLDLEEPVGCEISITHSEPQVMFSTVGGMRITAPLQGSSHSTLATRQASSAGILGSVVSCNLFVHLLMCARARIKRLLCMKARKWNY